MTDLPLDVQLDVDESTGDLAGIAFDWLDGLSQTLAAPERHALARLPARVAVNRADPFGPLGEPGSLFGIVVVSRGRIDAPAKSVERNCSDAGLRWLRQELSVRPRSASLWIGRLDERGHRSGTDTVLTADFLPHSPGWLRLSAQVNESRFTDPDTGPAEQRRWLDAVRPYADRFNPGFGHISYAYYDGATALEDCLPAHDPQYTIGQSRTILRGYSWLTIVPKELAAALGGADALSRSGAFADVETLAHGGLWLLATADYRDYSDAAIRKVFQALAPAMHRGMPRSRRQLWDQPPHPIVFADAGAPCGS
jgi:hypothetical protein